MKVGKPLLSEDEIINRVEELGKKITKDYQDNRGGLLIVGVFRGAFIFLADLVRHIKCPIAVDFMIVESPAGATSPDEIKFHSKVTHPIKGLHVLVVEDVVDTGVTLTAVRNFILNCKPASLKVCALINKQNSRIIDVPLDYIGFEIPTDKFMVGYGFDYQDKYRNLPYIGIYQKE